jgi:hypothetical protein
VAQLPDPKAAPFLRDGEVPLRPYKALMRTETTPGGSMLVNCPYCLLFWRSKNPIDITKWADAAGKRLVRVECSKGHKLVFRSMDEFQDARRRQGAQAR